ncbi:MAG: TetR/AcrR family transcriptional regulator [Actinomycetota bacterium]
MPRPSRWNDIVDTAAEAFRRNGFAATSLEEIAAEVGMWKGSLYHYISSKEELLFAVVREPAERILGEIEELAATDLPASEQLRRAARSHVTVLEEHYVYACVYLQEIAGRGRFENWAAMDRQYVDVLERIVQNGIDAGDFDRSLDARLTALAFVGSFNWLTHWYDPDGELAAVTIGDRFTDLFLGGVLRRGPSGRSMPSQEVEPTAGTTNGPS